MKILIVEDETIAYENMAGMLEEINPSIVVLGNTESVTETVDWLESNPAPDLILMDIHLSDGSAFTIFDLLEVDIPIVFTTAYDEYAIDAFKVNSIDYLLKPIKIDDLKQSLNKFKKFNHADIMKYLSQMNMLATKPVYDDKILLSHYNKLIPVDLSDVSFIYCTEKNARIYLNNGNSYPYTKSLDQTMRTLNPDDFIRANKQFIIAKKSVVDITIWFDNRLLITMNIDTPERIYVSKNKAAEFKKLFTEKRFTNKP
jgi:DNA-binding LytR/AlgR family response regulator